MSKNQFSKTDKIWIPKKETDYSCKLRYIFIDKKDYAL